MDKFKTQLIKYRFVILAVPVVLGGTYLGYKLRNIGETPQENAKRDARLKLRKDGLAEYKISENEAVIVTPEEISLRMKKIQLEQAKISLQDRIEKLQTKIQSIKDRTKN